MLDRPKFFERLHKISTHEIPNPSSDETLACEKLCIYGPINTFPKVCDEDNTSSFPLIDLPLNMTEVFK